MHVGIQWVHVGRCVSNVIRLDGDSKWQNTLYVGIQKKTSKCDWSYSRVNQKNAVLFWKRNKKWLYQNVYTGYKTKKNKSNLIFTIILFTLSSQSQIGHCALAPMGYSNDTIRQRSKDLRILKLKLMS